MIQLNDVSSSTGKWVTTRFSLWEVLNSDRILWCRSLIKENINFWEEDLTCKNKEYFTVIEAIFEIRTQEIAESLLNGNSAEVATVTAGYVFKKLIKRSKCKTCKMLLKSRDVEITNDTYLSIVSRGWPLVPPKLFWWFYVL